jgi:hypothetical protein
VTLLFPGVPSVSLFSVCCLEMYLFVLVGGLVGCVQVFHCCSLRFLALPSILLICVLSLVGWMVGCLKFIGFQCVGLCYQVFPCFPLYFIDMSLFALVGWLGPEPQFHLILSPHPVSIHSGPKGLGALNPSFT